ncbi:hypothetical protein CDD80_1125 [Ophiocordyceps camponoti-rufipedis]|uniref:Urease accessory protein UreF n=1 Tax=Ophiocordyceps camponoti-rufipedis TaxID=2004952 RepID=A0A2C5Z7B6_9HYPO|nr:hypothetical protein CDD80_1125 [Ophiocordyceps camponoti-rufipedis]
MAALLAQDDADAERLQAQVTELEARLAQARARLTAAQTPPAASTPASGARTPPATHPQSPGGGASTALQQQQQQQQQHLNLNLQSPPPPPPPPARSPPTTHFLLLLADSALPIGCFAFSSGLESFLAHGTRPTPDLAPFLAQTLSSTASTSLPFFLAAHRHPDALVELDDELDAAVVCAVARRASVAQGRALLAVWERSFAGQMADDDDDDDGALRRFAALLRASSAAATAGCVDDDDVGPVQPSAHFAPLFGAVCAVAGLAARQAAYVFLLGHARAVVSAAVRAGVFGPYQAQRVLAAHGLRDYIDALVEREWCTPSECAGQSVPLMDLWIGRHELLYSRIFNS